MAGMTGTALPHGIDRSSRRSSPAVTHSHTRDCPCADCVTAFALLFLDSARASRRHPRPWARSAPSAASAARSSRSRFPAPGWAMPRRSFTTRRASRTVSLKKLDDNNVRAKIKIAADCPLGLHDFRVRTATGISELRTFSVGALKEVNEVEPNNDFAAPQAIPMNVTVNGIADNEDVDYYVVEAKKGDRISVEVEGLRLGISEFDPYVAILDAKRFELGVSDDAALAWRDGFTAIIAPQDGKYIIQVRESAYSGNCGCLYRLHVGNFPRATAVMPAGGKPGETVAVRLIGDAAGETTSTIKLPPTFEREFGIDAHDDKGLSPYPNAFRLSNLGNVIEKEPNDDQAHATPFVAPMALNGVIEKAGDVDQFVFKATQGQVYDIHCYARRIRSPLDPVMYLGKKGGGAMLGADDSVGPDSYFRFQAPETAEYVIWLVDQLGKGGPDYAYRIELTRRRACAHHDDQCRTDSAGNRRDVGGGTQGKPAGDSDSGQSRRLRWRGQRRRRQTCPRA